MAIHPYTPADYAQLVAIDQLIYPNVPRHVQNYVERDETLEAKNPDIAFKRWVYELDGQIVGYASHTHGLWNFHSQKFYIDVRVHPDYQKQGIGTQLYNLLGESIAPHDPPTIFAEVFEPHTDALSFAQKRGYEITLREGELRLNVADFKPSKFETLMQSIAEQGVIIKSMAGWAQEIPNMDREVYDLDMAISVDVPMSEPFVSPLFETWHETVWQRETHLKEGLMLARHNGQFIGLSMIWRNRGSTIVNQDLTGVVRQYRGKKLGLALKMRVINYCIANGYTSFRTQNEQDNMSMLKTNQHLGFQKQPDWIFVTNRFAAD